MKSEVRYIYAVCATILVAFLYKEVFRVTAPNTAPPRGLPYGHDVFDVPKEHGDNAADHAIDKLVYELYGLCPDEIRIVEGKQ